MVISCNLSAHSRIFMKANRNIQINKIEWNLLLLIGSFLVFAMNQLPFLLDMRPIMYDEPWYLNPAYNLLHGDGLRNTLVGSGGNVNFVAPVLMAGTMLIFGESLLVVRLLAVGCGFIGIWVLHLILNEVQASNWTRILTLGMFLSISLINSVFRYVRPEFAVALFFLIGMLFTLRYNRTHSWLDMLLLCVSVYLASCSHPYSLLFFAYVGIYMLIDCLQKREYCRIYQLLLLLVSAMLVIISLFVVNNYANPNAAINSILGRLSFSNVQIAMCVSMMHVFIKHGVYTIPFLLFNIYAIVKHTNIRWLAIINILFIFTFPIIFSSDLSMVGNSVLYFSLVSIILFAFCGILEKQLSVRKRKMFLILCVVFCMVNFAISTTFNYLKRYEKCNSILEEDIDVLIPDNATVFGPIRFWPFKMNTNYFCDHNEKEMIPSEFDYLLFNSVDELLYQNVPIVQGVKTSMDKYELIYTKKTKQYGLVTIWKHK